MSRELGQTSVADRRADAEVRTGPFIIFVSKKPEESEIAFECRRKGFLVGASFKTKGGFGFILSMSPKLVVKMALEVGLPLQSFTSYSSSERLSLSSAAIKIIERAKSIDAEDVWISHDKNMLKDVDASVGDAHLADIKEYYGSKIAMYFGWLAFYTKILSVPSIAGVLLFCHQMYLGDVDSIWVPFFCVLITVWSTYFLEFWKRRGNELSFNWKVYGVEDEDAEQDLAKAAAKAEGNIAVRQMLSFVTVLSLMYVMIRIMLYYKSMQLNANSIYGEDSYYKYYPTLLYSVLPAVATMAFEPIAAVLNKFEGHTTKTDAENSRIMKYFALEFVNRYCALFHAAFWLKDLDVLRSLLISLLTINALLNNAIELGMPMIKSYLNRLENRKKMKKEQTAKGAAAVVTTNSQSNGSLASPVAVVPSSTSAATTASATAPAACKAEDPVLKSILEEELAYTDYDLNSDYLEIVIQYGYVTMFVVAFPLAPALALLNNIFESKVDLFKLTECRRPRLLQRSNIGSWQHCMEFISFLSVITNCYLIVMVSTHFEMIVPDGLEPYMQSETGRLIAMMVMEHVLLGFKIMMMYVIDDVPRWIREAIAQQNSMQREASTKERINRYAEGDLNPQAALSPRHRRTSQTMAFLQSLAGRPQKSGAVPSLNAGMDASQAGGTTPRYTGEVRNTSTSNAKSPTAMSSERDDVSVLTTETVSERPQIHKRAAKFLSHLTGRSHTKPTTPVATPAAAPVPASAPMQPVALAPITIPASTPRTLTRAQDSLLDEVVQYTEIMEPPAASPTLHYTMSMESMENEEVVDPFLNGGNVPVKTVIKKETPKDRLVRETASPFGFDPAQMMILICLPMALQYFNITPWLYLPLAVLFFGYLQQKKDRIDRKIAMGIVTDPTLLRLILEEMPSWPHDGEFQQLEWVNYMMQKFWPMLAIVGEEKALRIGQPILNRMKPSFLSELTIKKFNFGTIAPRFLGIRMIGTREEEGVIRCDLEMRYAGDPQIIIQVGPTVVEILNLRISCTMRCEMLEFTPRMTPFKLASATMMKKPFVDFNIKVAGLDIMSTRAMTNLVHNLFHKVLHTVCMYPKKIFVPMGPSDPNAPKVDLEAYKVLNPVGILYLTLERGVDLIQANVFGSDPYVDIETTDQDIRSSIIYNTVNPEWNETFDIIVYDRRSQVVSFTVMDFDMANNTKCLGKAEFEVNKVPFNTTVQKALTLTGVAKGTLVVSCTYIPMSSSYKTNGDNNAAPLTATEKARQRTRRLPRSVFKGANQADDDDSGEKDVLFDLPIEELHSDELLITGDLALQKIDEVSPSTPPTHAGLGILMISSIRLRSIRAGASGNWKPCVSFHVGVMKKQTRSKKFIVNPEFEERFAFVVKDRSMMDRILVKVMDKRKIMTQSRQIGEASVNLYDLLHMNASGPAGATIDKEYEVVSENVEYMVGFKMQWFSANK